MLALVRALLCLAILALSGVVPALAWAQPADPCLTEVDGAHDQADEDCLAACHCPCCPVRVHFTPLELTPHAPVPAPRLGFTEPSTPLRAGIKGDIFHPPSP